MRKFDCGLNLMRFYLKAFQFCKKKTELFQNFIIFKLFDTDANSSVLFTSSIPDLIYSRVHYTLMQVNSQNQGTFSRSRRATLNEHNEKSASIREGRGQNLDQNRNEKREVIVKG